jgi:threonine dehydrogenase-like Zn-dependent dehydrogenase
LVRHYAVLRHYRYDRARQAMMLESDRPAAPRQAIMACRNGGILQVIEVYDRFIDMLLMGSVMNRSITIRTGQCNVPGFVITHNMRLEDAPPALAMFSDTHNDCIKIVWNPN